MKRFSSFLSSVAMCGALTAPASAFAAWDWVPRVLKYENPYRETDLARSESFVCKLRNSWGDCVVFSYNAQTKIKQKSYYRRVSSYEGTRFNFSECQYDAYRRETSPHTFNTVCDYGAPRSYETR